TVGRNAFEHRADELVDEHRFKVLRSLRRLGGVLCRTRLCKRFACQDRRGELQIGRGHYITWISACRAPAALIACRIEIMSRGPTPRAFSPLTSVCRLTPLLSTTSRLPLSSSTSICVRGTTTVWPCCAKGCG